MNRFTILLCCLLLSTAQNIFAQDFDVPENYVLKTKEDYAPYEKDIIAASKWLQATPFDKQKEKRREVSAFVVTWVNGSPTVNVEITPIIMDFEGKNQGMLVLYMAASAQYVLEHNDTKDMRAKHKAALHAMMNAYKSNKSLNRDKKMEQLIQSDADGKLDDWLEDNMKVNK